MLVLYQAEHCDYSREVRKVLTELGLSFVAHNPRFPGKMGGDVVNEEVLDAMVAIGGEDQIPFLVDTDAGVHLYESDAIIQHLRDTYG